MSASCQAVKGPARAMVNTSKLMRPLAAYSEKRPVISTSEPTATGTPAAW